MKYIMHVKPHFAFRVTLCKVFTIVSIHLALSLKSNSGRTTELIGGRRPTFACTNIDIKLIDSTEN